MCLGVTGETVPVMAVMTETAAGEMAVTDAGTGIGGTAVVGTSIRSRELRQAHWLAARLRGTLSSNAVRMPRRDALSGSI